MSRHTQQGLRTESRRALHSAILRNLLHLGGHIDYSKTAITVTLDRPDSPRIARALELLAEELNASPACLPGDRRPLTYQVATA